jgi:hypothetical protein
VGLDLRHEVDLFGLLGLLQRKGERGLAFVLGCSAVSVVRGLPPVRAGATSAQPGGLPVHAKRLAPSGCPSDQKETTPLPDDDDGSLGHDRLTLAVSDGYSTGARRRGPDGGGHAGEKHRESDAEAKKMTRLA